jgi:ABC-2 type transport system permease protein
MNVVLTTVKKELRSYFYNPVGWVIAVLFYLLRGFEAHAMTRVYAAFEANRDQFSTAWLMLQSSTVMVLLVPPILTMRCFAEEKRTGSLEVLMTAPVKDLEVVLGKWLAALLFFALLWLPTLPLLWIQTWPQFLGTSLAFGPVVAGYVGLTLLGALLLAIGCFTSSLTDNQLLSSLTAILAGTALMNAPGWIGGLGQDEPLPGLVRQLVEQGNIGEQLSFWFMRGLIDSGHVLFYAVGAALFLGLTVLALGFRRGTGWLQVGSCALLGVLIWGMAVVLSARPGLSFRIDLSPQARFTMSRDTEDLLAELRKADMKVEFHTFFEPLQQQAQNEQHEEYLKIQRRLQDLTRDLLRLYRKVGGESVTVVEHDLLRQEARTREFSQTVALNKRNAVVVKLGKRSKTLSVDLDLGEIDFPTQEQGPPGTGHRLPLLKDFKGEEAISSALKGLQVEGSAKVYWVTGLMEASFEAPIGHSYSELANALGAEGFQVLRLDLEREKEIPADAGVLALVEPRYEITPAVAGKLVAWLQRGGRLFVNLAWVEEPDDHNPTLEALGQRLGFEIGKDLVCHLIEDPRNPNRGTGGPQSQTLAITEMSPVHPVTRPLLLHGRTLYLKAGREIRRRAGPEPAGTRLDPSLLRTGPMAWIETRGQSGEVDYYPAQDLRRDAFEPRCVGAVVTVDPVEGGKRPGQVLLVSGVGFINDAIKSNGDFVLNAFQWLAERKELVGVRGDRYVPRSLKATPQQLERVRWLLVAIVPGLLLVLGATVLFVRSRA